MVKPERGMTMKAQNVWKSCRLHARLAENPIGLSLSIAFLMTIAALPDTFPILTVLAGWIPLLLSITFFDKGCRMIFGRTTYEQDGCFVRCMPLTEKELLGGKLLLGSLTAFGVLFFLSVAFLELQWTFGSWLWGKRFRYETVLLYEKTGWGMIAAVLALGLLLLALYAVCLAALYSIRMARVYRRSGDAQRLSSINPLGAILLLPPILLAVPALKIKDGLELQTEVLSFFLLSLPVLAVLAGLLIRAAYRKFPQGNAEYRVLPARRGKERSAQKIALDRALLQAKSPAQVYGKLLRCGSGSKLLHSVLQGLLLILLLSLQGASAYVAIVLLICSIGRIQYESDTAMLYGEQAAFYQMFPLETAQKVRIHMYSGFRVTALSLLLAVNGWLVFLAARKELPSMRSGEAVLTLLLLELVLLTGVMLCSGIILFSAGFGNLWRDPVTRKPSQLAGVLCEIGMLSILFVGDLLLLTHARIPRIPLFGGVAVVQAAGCLAFYRLNIWLLEKKYAV